MALINCYECGKEISDKATNCPNCGAPTNSPNVEIESTQVQEDGEYLCCPKCSSRELHTEHKGFSGGKALSGALLAGGVGLLAGTIGSKDVQITCLKCGNKFKAGEAKIVKTGSIANDLERRVLWLLCENKTEEARQLYKSETHSTGHETHLYLMKLIEKIPENQTDEQKEKRRKYYEDLQKGKGGCLGIVFLLIISIITISLI